MIYFKSKLITILYLFILMMIHDSFGIRYTYTGQKEVQQYYSDTPGGPRFVTSSQQQIPQNHSKNEDVPQSPRASGEEVCLHTLNEAGYDVPDSGLQLYLDKFEEIMINQKEEKIVVNQKENKIDFMPFFICDLFVHVYSLVDIANAEAWCEGKGVPYDIVGCSEELRNKGFIFEHGIDNYAYLILREKRNEKITFAENSFSSDCIGFLIEQIELQKNNLENADKWCKINECDIALREVGYKDRYTGGNNRSGVSNCSNQLGQRLPTLYCNYVWTDKNKMDAGVWAGRSNLFENEELLGTHGWCKKYGVIETQDHRVRRIRQLQ